MKLALIADLHLGSKAIGDGLWKMRAIEQLIVPKLKEMAVTHLIFPGDTLDFKQGTSSMSADRCDLVKFTADQFGSLSIPGYLLVGNHDDFESCRFLEILAGGPKIQTDRWVDLGEGYGAYLMRGRQDKRAALTALATIDTSMFKSRILVLHEDLDVFHDNEFLATTQNKFNLVVNGHNHVFRPVREKVYLLPACLPWQARRGSQCDLEVKYSADGQVTTSEKEAPWGFIIVGNDLVPKLVPVDGGVRLTICEVEATQEKAADAIRKTLESVASRGDAKTLVVRVYVTARVDSGLREHVSRWFPERFFDAVQVQSYQGAGAVHRELRERLPTEEVALNAVRIKHGENARKVVEQLADFFQLKVPQNRKKEILTIIQGLAEGSFEDGTAGAS